MSSRAKIILIGAFIGAVLGATAAWAYTNTQGQKLLDSQRSGEKSRLRAGASDYVKIGMSLLSLVRQVTDLFKQV